MSSQPDYVSFEPKAREELLSRVGSFTPVERKLFHRLCESWAPVIDRNRFLSGSGGTEQERTALDRLMTKLRNAELGVVTTEIVGGKTAPTGLVLTSKGDLEFYIRLLDEEARRLRTSGFHILPSEEVLTSRRAVPPPHHITDADPIMLADTYLANEPEDGILRIRLLGEYRILTTTRAVRDLMNSSITWLRANLDERGLIDEVARIKNTGIMELKQRLTERSPEFWLDLCRSIVDERKTIAYRKNLRESDEFFQTAFLVMTFNDARIGAARARKERDNRVDEELEHLMESVEQTPGGRMSAEVFSLHIHEAEGRLRAAAGTFSKRVQLEVLTPKARRKLPVVAAVANTYVHRNRVCAVFEHTRVLVAERLHELYIDLLEAFLRGRSPEMAEIFASRADLDQHVRTQVERMDDLLAELLNRPQMLAEAVIRDAKLKNEDVTPIQIRSLLGRYFNVTDSALRPASELFDLDIVGVYDAAYGRLNVFRQLMLRISGRHESLRRSYVRRFGPARSRVSYADDGDAGPPQGGRTRTERGDAPGIRVRGAGSRAGRHGAAARTGGRPPKPKPRSAQEVDRAWKDFDQAIHTARQVPDIDESFGDVAEDDSQPGSQS
jgi:hypothetical protein